MVTSDLRPMGSQTQRADLVPFRFFKLSRPRRAFDESPVGLILINLAAERDILASQLPTATITLRPLELALQLKIQCEQFGLFLKHLGDKFSCKSSPNIWQILEQFGAIRHILVENSSIHLLGNFWCQLGKFLLQNLVTLILK